MNKHLYLAHFLITNRNTNKIIKFGSLLLMTYSRETMTIEVLSRVTPKKNESTQEISIDIQIEKVDEEIIKEAYYSLFEGIGEELDILD